ncbi:signal transduction histidine kinase, nitrogen specific [Thioflavicoccus mobilis 8321]|uniref:Sensory histidine kinase/phosphatase NtrB n=1 Tax=Thioflavicoccus mobilis 8321 TaxID=765912 RepID=L0H275_9GAMM|nr:nitrogen regulation protein NR(II) [Thioflavicoccus mobilis]AGA92336.1 signal transduction histidine kinase, nitrogen specific [Thioflavicoccus mobilis 8321]
MMNPRSATTSLENTVLDNLSTAVLLFDNDLHLKYLNPAAEMVLAVSARHVVGLRVAEIVPCRDDGLERRLRVTMLTKHPFTEREMNVPLLDGRTITVNCTVLPLHHFDASDELLIELHQVDRQLRISREEQLISQHQASQALIRGLAHEIKNPLGGLRGAAQLLEQELPNKSLREYTRIIIEEADRLQSLMNQMLGPNRIPQRQRVNIHCVLEHVRGLLLAESPQGPRIERDYDPSIPDFDADQDRLVQAVLNIARNAVVAAGPQGTVMLRTRVLRQFTIGSQRHRLVLRAEVEDDGPGIPDAIKNRIFFPMVSSQPGGTGLGLPIAQELINQHGGLIECESEPGKTQFYVYLPLEMDNE